MALNNIRPYVKPHTSDKGGTVIYNGGGGAGTYAQQNINVKSITSVQGDIDNLNAGHINAQDATISSINSDNANVKNIVGETLEYTQGIINELISNNIKTINLTADDTISAKNLTSQNINANTITTDKLYVNKSAHFFELVIDKIRSVNGTFINTAANCKVDYVEAYDSNDNHVDMDDPNFDPDDVDYFKIYWRNTDNEGNSLENLWLELDYAVCKSFNTTDNKYYWRLVTSTDNGTPVYINFDTKQISNTDLGSSLTFTTPIRYGGYDEDTQQYVYVNMNVTGDHYANNVWSPENIDESITVTPIMVETETGSGVYVKSLCKGGEINFVTNKPTELNITIVYDDGTIEYKQVVNNNGEQIYSTDYHIVTSSDKALDYVTITTSVIDKWDACNWICLSNDANNEWYDPNSSGLPEIGDEIAQLGYKYDDNSATEGPERASAIIIAAYATPDTTLTPPSYAQYQLINPLGTTPTNWNLGSYRATYFDANGGCVVGDFKVENKTTLHKTEINSSDGTFKMYGPTNINNPTTQSLILKLDWGLSDTSPGNCGEITVYDALHPEVRIEIDNAEVRIINGEYSDDINAAYTHLHLNLSGFNLVNKLRGYPVENYQESWVDIYNAVEYYKTH